MTYPILRVQVQVLDLAVVEEAREADAVVREVRLLADDDNVPLAAPGVQLEDLFDEGHAHHAEADDDQPFPRIGSHICVG